MLTKENYGIEHIKELHNKYKKDPGLLERVLYAFGLLEAIAQVGMPFIFKDGSCLMLMTDCPRRLSTDIDILVEQGTDIDRYIVEAAKIFPFKTYEEQKRIGKNQIEKRHFKFVYDSPFRNTEFYILLDVVFSECPYLVTIEKGIENSLLWNEGAPTSVTIPSPDCILGDKLTAFAPHTTGVPFGVDKELEIIKQLYDVATLTELLSDQEALKKTYEKAVSEELAYRGLKLSKEDVLRDTIRATACIIGKGSMDKEEYPLFLRGIQALDSHVMDRRYSGEIAAHQACKTMYLAACLLTGQPFGKIENPEAYIGESIGKSRYKKFSYMKKQKLESYGYLVEAVKLLEE